MAKYEYKVKGVDYVVEIQDIEGNIANVTVNGIPFEVEMKQPVKSSKQKVKLSDGQNNISASSVASAGSAAGSSSAASSDSASSSKQATPAAGKPVVAPLPGTINEIKVKVGDKVNTGDTVVVLEAMKMQNNIDAETSGTITSINVNKGDAVTRLLQSRNKLFRQKLMITLPIKRLIIKFNVRLSKFKVNQCLTFKVQSKSMFNFQSSK